MKKLTQAILIAWMLIGLAGRAQAQGTVTANSAGIKYNPGHYVAMGPHINLPEIKHLQEPALRGVNKRYHWRILEPEKGVYDFSAIEKDLAYCEAQNKQLVVFLCDKSFWKRGAVPHYLKQYELPYPDGSFNPVRWEPEYIDRFIALGEAIGERFNDHPNFEGLAIQESALGLTEEDYAKFGYTPEKYRDALITILNGMREAMPNCQIFWYQNGIHENDGHLKEIADTMSGKNVVMGGPDILPHRRWLRYTYRIYREYKGKIKLFCSAQDDSYHHHKNDIRLADKEPVPEEGYLTMEEIFLYARDSMHINYLFWNYYYQNLEENDRTFDEVVEVIQEYPEFNTGEYDNSSK
ncbi:hypothetical protein AB9P05_04375 [Roseivirga sp. BDSF3-8]|uniref:hypothetical protein n=1 Tax=Roseivirga sp. BDSF3-8 TaxID=3241598 RepID=UPI0035322564